MIPYGKTFFYLSVSTFMIASKFLRIFPIVSSTCISAHRLGEPKPYFDMVIMDVASQCNTAVSPEPVRMRSIIDARRSTV